jgi:glutathionylspermidine synthase
VQRSPLNFNHTFHGTIISGCTRVLHVPKLFDAKDREVFEKASAVFYEIFERIIDAFQSDMEVRRLFRFRPILNYLAMRKEPGWKIPILRIDIFYNEKTGDFKVCEFNTDGSSAMMENDLAAAIMQENNSLFAHFHPEVKPVHLVDDWIDALLAQCVKAGIDTPSIVITDFFEKSYYPELVYFEKRMQERGLQAKLVDIRDLEYENGKLKDPASGMEFNTVYRRAVTKDIIENSHDIIPFLKAVENQDVFLVGGFQTQIIHSKSINTALESPVLQKYLTKEQLDFLRKHMPKTLDLTYANADRIKKEKDFWVIKPKEGYASKGVWAGVGVDQNLWNRLVNDAKDMGYIAQEYIPHYRTENIDPVHEQSPSSYANMSGLYVFNGKFAGVYSRLSQDAIISTQYNERMTPSFFLQGE